MISTGQIIAAGLITGAAVGIAGWLVRWRLPWILVSAIASLVLIVAWRAASNLLGLNSDFVPAVSLGDTGCLLLGALPSAAVAVMPNMPRPLRWVPAAAGGLAGFAVNVVIL